MGSLRILLSLVIFVCMTLGLLALFDVVSTDYVSKTAGKVFLGIGVVFLGILALQLISGRSANSSSETEPPPRL